MADIKISEMEELLPYNDLEKTGGVQDEDVLTILDVSELEPAKLNKKVKVSTLLEKYSQINSPIFTGSPKTPTPSLTLQTATNIVNVNWVVEKLKQLTLPDLADVQSTLNPQDGQTLVYDSLSNEWKAGSSTTTNRESLTNTKTLSNTEPTYQFLSVGSGDSQDLILPPGTSGSRFVVKNISPENGSILIKEGSTVIGTADFNTQVVECIHDGTEWNVLRAGTTPNLGAKGALLSQDGVEPITVPPGTSGQTLVRDDAAPSGLNWVNLPVNNQSFNPVVTSDFILDDSYNNRMIPIDTTNGDIIITLGTNLQQGFQIIIYHYGGGKVTIAPDGQVYRARGNTILNSNAAITLSFDLATNTWYGIGDLVQE